MLTVGVELTTMVMVWLPVLPPESVADAVMTCVPEVRVLLVSDAPVPRMPSRSEDQRMVREVSSKSVAVAVKVIDAPCSKVEPVAGPVMFPVGVELTTTVMDAEVLLPPESVTEAVMVWVPELSVLLVSDTPVPRLPSRLDDQATEVRVPSSRSLALAVKVIAWPCSKVLPVAGAVMLNVGVELTTTVIEALAVFPPESVTEAVMVWVPERSVVTLSEGAVPRVPSRFDDQRMAVMAPSSRSLAVPVNVTVAPCSNDALFAGVEIDTVGMAFTMTVIAALVRLPPLSVTDAVMVCVPERSVDTASGEPVPRVPSRFEFHRIDEARLPSYTQRAVAVA